MVRHELNYTYLLYILIYLEDKDMADYFVYIYMSLILLSIIIREISLNYKEYYSDYAAVLS